MTSSSLRLPPGFEIRRLKTTDEYHAAAELQGDAWGIIDRVDISPVHVLVTAQKNGGLVLGAFAPDGDLAGFLFGFLGTTADGTLKHVSHQMGVKPKYRGLSLGYLLKRAQRGEVRRQGIDLITWTFDPLETVNANLNLTQLGAVDNTYLRNIYGEIRDKLNTGLPSDRFQVDWWIRSQWVHERLSLAHPVDFAQAVRTLPVVNPAKSLDGEPGVDDLLKRGVLEPGDIQTDLDAPDLLLQVPFNFQAVKSHDMGLGLAWRLHTRAAFEHFFGSGYTAIEMLRGQTADGPRAYYRLIRVPEPAPWQVREHTPPENIPPISEALAEFAQLFNAGQYWKAHEVLEAPWSVAQGEDRAFLQGLIRAAAAFHKLLAHGNPQGADNHLTWVINALSALDPVYRGVNTGAFVDGLRRVQAGLPDVIYPADYYRHLIPKVEIANKRENS
jgi:predicted GNAT superfamily acetyltransferase